MIQVQNIRKSFVEGDSTREVLHGITADFYDGKTNLIMRDAFCTMAATSRSWTAASSRTCARR